jgi:hypothetical protein
VRSTAGTAGVDLSIPAIAGAGGGQNAGNDECSEASKLIYVIGRNGKLASFLPSTLKFSIIGDLDCEMSPHSMAVDRSGTAWVLDSAGSIWKVSTANARCTSTSYAPNQHNFFVFGMGYASNTAGSSDETLFVVEPANGLGRIDTATLQLTPVAVTDPSLGRGELTGTGKGELFGFFPDSKPVTVTKLDKANGKTLEQYPVDLDLSQVGFAFAFWGGDFWLFTFEPGSPFSKPGDDPPSRVHHYVTATQKTSTVVEDAGLAIVGAGVSTCAPTEPVVK